MRLLVRASVRAPTFDQAARRGSGRPWVICLNDPRDFLAEPRFRIGHCGQAVDIDPSPVLLRSEQRARNGVQTKQALGDTVQGFGLPLLPGRPSTVTKVGNSCPAATERQVSTVLLPVLGLGSASCFRSLLVVRFVRPSGPSAASSTKAQGSISARRECQGAISASAKLMTTTLPPPITCKQPFCAQRKPCEWIGFKWKLRRRSSTEDSLPIEQPSLA
jgi:hypothetical protein